jgi:hypothetical protein
MLRFISLISRDPLKVSFFKQMKKNKEDVYENLRSKKFKLKINDFKATIDAKRGIRFITAMMESIEFFRVKMLPCEIQDVVDRFQLLGVV